MKKMRLGILGLGRAGRGNHLGEIASGAADVIEIAAVCDILPERADEVAAQYGCKAYYDIGDLLRDENVDVVDIATRSCDHAAHAMLALQADKDVILEKPMSTCIEDARAVYEYAEKLGRKLYIRHNRRWEGPFNQAMELCDSGKIGDVFEVKLTRNGFETRNDWQTLRQFGGGQLLNWGPHIVDQTLRFAGNAYTKLYSDIKQINASGNCEDHIKIVITGINGRTVDMEISSGCASDQPLYEGYGTRGSFKIYPDHTEIRSMPEDFQLTKLPSVEATPGTGANFGNEDVIPWIDETVPTVHVVLDQVWRGVYEDWAGIRPYRIKKEEALAVIELISRVKKDNPDF